MGNTRRVVDGEERMTVRPLRPAVPPDGGADHRPVPKPRGTVHPDSTSAPTSDAEPADAKPADAPTGDAKPADIAASNAKPADAPTGDAKPADAEPATDAPAGGRRRRSSFAHAVRVPPRQLAVGAARATRAWSRRPSGRMTLPGLFLLVLVAATATAGALLVPAAIRKPQPVAVDATATAPGSGVPEGGAVPGGTDLTPGPAGTGDPLATLTPTPTATGPIAGVPGRPADALAGWAQQVGQRAGIPVVAAQAYGYAELVLRQTKPSCQLSWTTLAAIGYVESRHGSANGATLRPDGVSVPEIVGPPLNGQGGTSRIPDSDQGQLDHDTVWDHAIGPMQFIPSTWQTVGADGDNDGVRNPHDIDDAALAAGNYLCQGGRNMSIPGDWWGAILSYNDVRRYAQDVFDKANDYGRLSRT
ncbi:lytic murein transglycosylase [Micromonospora yasonensis]|uniref:lytic transglycosylase domain-containing protein n=1 Tax=Micromonospora yasonensis TaxID=1128667 RepID=UPI002230CBDD|nr:lytic murein transglycosylase [Micromonospora yasonensis]MCW3842224.1 lytic murein transglycosylase [Micromonospora yasonensis]